MPNIDIRAPTTMIVRKVAFPMAAASFTVSSDAAILFDPSSIATVRVSK
ncbi:Uncharacterised protein [Mycobacterium tuberculosis]|nr:Uncharacterised protein [Mycobacterium tuberculosis]COZ44849.1 Uncharacterised protein [Mycobacterium tuberculosis]